MQTDTDLQVQLDVYLSRAIHIRGSFAQEGAHSVAAVLETHEWEQNTAPRRVEIPINVVPINAQSNSASGMLTLLS